MNGNTSTTRYRLIGVAAVLLLSSCSSDASVADEPPSSAPATSTTPITADAAPSTTQVERVTVEEFTEQLMDTDIPLEDIPAIDTGFEPAATFCAAVGTLPLHFADGAMVPITAFADVWSAVGDPPAEVAEDVAALVTHADTLLDWNLGRIDRDQRPPTDATLVSRYERIMDAAVENCETLPTSIGRSDDWAAGMRWSAEEAANQCAASAQDLADGRAVYLDLRGREAGHPLQIEYAILTEFYLAFEAGGDAPPLWFAPSLHGIAGYPDDIRVVALPPCTG